MANIILPLASQIGLGPQYYTAWTSAVSGATYGIDATNTNPTQTNGGTTVIETDLIPTGDIFGKQKKTFGGIEFKLVSPLVAGESVVIKYRTNPTGTWNTLGTQNLDSSNLAGTYQATNLQGSLWAQFQISMTSTATNPSFCRLKELRIHQA